MEPNSPGESLKNRNFPGKADTHDSEFRVEYLNPPYMTLERPQLSNAPKQIAFNSKFHVDIQIPRQLERGEIKGSGAFFIFELQINPP
jgi:hypothetical protein